MAQYTWFLNFYFFIFLPCSSRFALIIGNCETSIGTHQFHYVVWFSHWEYIIWYCVEGTTKAIAFTNLLLVHVFYDGIILYVSRPISHFLYQFWYKHTFLSQSNNALRTQKPLSRITTLPVAKSDSQRRSSNAPVLSTNRSFGSITLSFGLSSPSMISTV